MKLSCTLIDEITGNKTESSMGIMNEVTIHRGMNTQLGRLDVFIGDNHLTDAVVRIGINQGGRFNSFYTYWFNSIFSICWWSDYSSLCSVHVAHSYLSKIIVISSVSSTLIVYNQDEGAFEIIFS
jgi:hypothetical protein